LSKLVDFKNDHWFESYRLKNKRYWPNEEHSDGRTDTPFTGAAERWSTCWRVLLNEAEFSHPAG